MRIDGQASACGGLLWWFQCPGREGLIQRFQISAPYLGIFWVLKLPLNYRLVGDSQLAIDSHIKFRSSSYSTFWFLDAFVCCDQITNVTSSRVASLYQLKHFCTFSHGSVTPGILEESILQYEGMTGWSAFDPAAFRSLGDPIRCQGVAGAWLSDFQCECYSFTT